MFAGWRRRLFALIGLSCVALGAIFLPTGKTSIQASAERPTPSSIDTSRLVGAINDFDVGEQRQKAAHADAVKRSATIANEARKRFAHEAGRIADELSSAQFIGKLAWAKARENLPAGYGGYPDATEQLVRSIVSRRYRLYRKDAGLKLLGEVAGIDGADPIARAVFVRAFSEARLDLSRHLIMHLPSAAKILRRLGKDAAIRYIKKLPITQLDGPLVIFDVVAFAFDLRDLYGAAVAVQKELRLVTLGVVTNFYAAQIGRDLAWADDSLNLAYAGLRRKRCGALIAAYAATPVPSIQNRVTERCPKG